MSAHASVLVVEDHELMAETLKVALAAEDVAADLVPPVAAEAVLDRVESLRPELVLLDLALGEPIVDGASLIGPIRALGSAVLVVSGVTDRARLAAAVEAGALGYAAKAASFDRLLAVVRDALAGRPVLSEAERFELLAVLRRRRSGEGARLAPFARLTAREQQVLRELAEGRGVEEIARRWVVSPSTVRTQVRGVLTKLGVASQLAAVAAAHRSGWL